MSATRSITFSCDSIEGCMAYATVAGESVQTARLTLAGTLNWSIHYGGDLCPTHVGTPAAPRLPDPPDARRMVEP